MLKSKRLIRAIRLLRLKKGIDCVEHVQSHNLDEDGRLKDRIHQWLRESSPPNYHALSTGEDMHCIHRKAHHEYTSSYTSFDPKTFAEVLYHPDFVDWGPFEKTETLMNTKDQMNVVSLLDEAQTALTQHLWS